MAYLDNNGVLYFWQKIKTYVANAISGKVDAETGKGLSTNDYTTEEKTKLSNISAGAQVNVLEGIQKNGDTVTITNKIANISVPTKTSDLTNDSNFITLADVPDGAVASTTTPKMDGTAAAGSETAFARGDHVHPSDTSKLDVSVYNTAMQQITQTFAAKANSADVLNILKEYATKEDIASAYIYKGSVATVSALPSSDNTTGDVYNVEASGMNYAWNGSEWDALGEIFTITAITNAEIDTICT